MLRTALLATAAAACWAAAHATAASAPVQQLTLRGHGFGHGIGLSQWGAEARAAAGQSARQILSFYYPGTHVQQIPARRIRVFLASRPRLTVSSPAAMLLRGADGARQVVPAGRHVVSATTFDGTLLALPATLEPTSRAPLRLGGTAYEGSFELSNVGPAVRAVNVLPLERYVADVVSSECPGYWPPAALQAQAVASRSYALANLRPSEPFDVYRDDRSQNYHGLVKHLPRALSAAATTRGQALVYDGSIVNALFSASNGGRTSVPDGVWGGDRAPYFVVVDDPFDRGNPDANWGPVRLTIDRLRSSFPQIPPAVQSVTVTRNAGDRVTSLDFVGPDGSSATIAGYGLQQRFGLRSTYFSVATS